MTYPIFAMVKYDILYQEHSCIVVNKLQVPVLQMSGKLYENSDKGTEYTTSKSTLQVRVHYK